VLVSFSLAKKRVRTAVSEDNACHHPLPERWLRCMAGAAPRMQIGAEVKMKPSRLPIRSGGKLQYSEIVSILTADSLSTSQVAAFLDVSRWTLADMRLKREGPPFMRKKRGVIVYPRSAFEAYLRQRQIGRRLTGANVDRQDLDGRNRQEGNNGRFQGRDN
jgi:hypothetical protein